MKTGLYVVAGCSALSFAATPAAAGTLLPQPLLQYDFDASGGGATVADDGTAPQTDGTLTGGAAVSTDTPGGFSAFSVDLSNDDPFAHVFSTDAADLDGLGQLTLTTWLKVNDYTSGNNRLVAKQDGGNFGGFSFNMNATTNDGATAPDNFRLAVFLGGNAGGDFDGAFSDVDASAADWAFLAVTYDTTTSTVTFYQGDETNPVTVLGTPQVLGTNPGNVDGGTARFGIGLTDAAPTADTSVNGLQDDVRVYGAALTLADLEQVRLSNLVPEPAALLGLGVLGAAVTRRRR